MTSTEEDHEGDHGQDSDQETHEQADSDEEEEVQPLFPLIENTIQVSNDTIWGVKLLTNGLVEAVQGCGSSCVASINQVPQVVNKETVDSWKDSCKHAFVAITNDPFGENNPKPKHKRRKHTRKRRDEEHHRYYGERMERNRHKFHYAAQ